MITKALFFALVTLVLCFFLGVSREKSVGPTLTAMSLSLLLRSRARDTQPPHR